jgi:hypothetical protein
MRRTQIKSHFGNGFTVDPQIALVAAKAVVLHATDTEDAVMLLDVLGLIPPQEGNEPSDRGKVIKEQYAQAKKDRKLSQVDVRLKKANVTLEEIGEGH